MKTEPKPEPVDEYRWRKDKKTSLLEILQWKPQQSHKKLHKFVQTIWWAKHPAWLIWMASRTCCRCKQVIGEKSRRNNWRRCCLWVDINIFPCSFLVTDIITIFLLTPPLLFESVARYCIIMLGSENELHRENENKSNLAFPSMISQLTTLAAQTLEGSLLLYWKTSAHGTNGNLQKTLKASIVLNLIPNS